MSFRNVELIGENGLFRSVFSSFVPVSSSLIQSQEIAGNRGNSGISWKTGRLFHEMNWPNSTNETARSSGDGGPGRVRCDRQQVWGGVSPPPSSLPHDHRGSSAAGAWSIVFAGVVRPDEPFQRLSFRWLPGVRGSFTTSRPRNGNGHLRGEEIKVWQICHTLTRSPATLLAVLLATGHRSPTTSEVLGMTCSPRIGSTASRLPRCFLRRSFHRPHQSERGSRE